MTNAITPTSWFCNKFACSQKKSDPIFFSRVEIVFLLDSVETFSVPTFPTYMTITEMFNVCSRCKHGTSKRLTFGNLSEVLTKQILFVTCPSFFEKIQSFSELVSV